MNPDSQSPETPQTPAAPAVPDVSSVYPQPGAVTPMMTQASVVTAEQHRKRWLIVSCLLILLVVGALAAVAYQFTQQPKSATASDLTPITYDNGLRGRYSLPFYKDYEVKKIVISSPDSPGASANTKANALYSKTSVANKAPLVLQITDFAFSQQVADSWKPCPSGAPPSITVPNAFFGQNIVLCAIKSNGVDLIYVGVNSKDGRTYSFMALQDIDFSKQTTPEGYANIKAKADLSVYQTDLKTMLGAFSPAK